jgi:hypothetical protein
MTALPPLARILRYGNVRQTDAAMVAGVIHGLVTRIAIGLPVACGSLNDEASEEMFQRIAECHEAIGLLQNSEYSATWNSVLGVLADAPSLHGLIAGRACRLLLEARKLDVAEAARRFGLALSSANAPPHAAAWIDGFLRESGLLLLHDDSLWTVMDDWVTTLPPDHFIAALPLLRRTFSSFQPAERRQIGARVASGVSTSVRASTTLEAFDQTRADKALSLIAQLLGLRLGDGLLNPQTPAENYPGSPDLGVE